MFILVCIYIYIYTCLSALASLAGLRSLLSFAAVSAHLLSSLHLPPLLTVPRPSKMPPQLEVQRRVCLNEYAVPQEHDSLPWVNPFALASDEPDFLDVSLVSFKASGNLIWLQKSLELPSRWWLRHHHRVPLIIEILDLIRSQKATTGAAARLPRTRACLLPLQIRGKVLWFKNDSRVVIYAIRDAPGALDDFQWFLMELAKDIEEHAFNEAPEESRQSGSKEARVPIPEDLEEIVENTVKILQEHTQCLSATFLHSRMSIRVQRKSDKATKDFRVKDLNKKRQQACEQEDQNLIQRQFDLLVPVAIGFMDSEDVFMDSQDPGEGASSQPTSVPAQEPESSAPEAPAQAPAQELAHSSAPEPVGPAQAPAEAAQEPSQQPAPARPRRRVPLKRKQSQIFGD